MLERLFRRKPSGKSKMYTPEQIAKIRDDGFRQGKLAGDSMTVIYVPWSEGKRKDAYHEGVWYTQIVYPTYREYLESKKTRRAQEKAE